MSPPGAGKTSFAVQAAVATASLQRRVAYITVDEPVSSIRTRTLACLAGVPIKEITGHRHPGNTHPDDDHIPAFSDYVVRVLEDTVETQRFIHLFDRRLIGVDGMDEILGIAVHMRSLGLDPELIIIGMLELAVLRRFYHLREMGRDVTVSDVWLNTTTRLGYLSHLTNATILYTGHCDRLASGDYYAERAWEPMTRQTDSVMYGSCSRTAATTASARCGPNSTAPPAASATTSCRRWGTKPTTTDRLTPMYTRWACPPGRNSLWRVFHWGMPIPDYSGRSHATNTCLLVGSEMISGKYRCCSK